MKISKVILGFFLFAFLATAIAEIPTSFREGSHYFKLDRVKQYFDTSGKIEVVVMFLYGCPHCYELEPKLKKWHKSQPDVELKLVPAILGPTWAEMAKFYYTAEKLGVLDKLHDVFYASIHNDGKRYFDEGSIRRFFVKQGIDVDAYEEAYYDKNVMAKVNDARLSSLKYRMRGVPLVVVNNKYKTAPFYVKNQEVMIQVLDHLVDKERLAKQQNTTGFWQEITRSTALHEGQARSGKEVYEYRCVGCHGKNTQGAPMPGDKDEWNARLKKGMDVLMDHAINGVGVFMPPRGGCRNCRDDELQAAVQYMIDQDEITLKLVN